MIRFMRRRLAAARHHDGGFTLVELIVSSAVGILLLTMVGVLLVSTLKVQRQVLATTSTTNQAKLEFSSIEAATRLAVDTNVRSAANLSVAPASGQGNVLILKSRVNQGAVTAVSTWQCIGWYLAADGTLRRAKSQGQASGTPATAASPSTWPVVATGVTSISGSSPFVQLEADPSVSSWYPGSIVMNLQFLSSQSKVPVRMTSTIAPRRQLQLDGETPGGVPCV